jgi:LysM repeat protein
MGIDLDNLCLPEVKHKIMKQFLTIFAVAMLSLNCASAQEKIVKHTVAKGETITQIAQQYKVTPADIYRLNPDAQSGLKPNTVLLIQGSKVSQPVKDFSQVSKTHTVEAKETLYGIARLYGIAVGDLLNANPNLEKEGLKVGAVIQLPSNAFKTGGIKPAPGKKMPIYHTVEAKETKYAIARQYGTTVAQLEKDNPEIAGGLQIGFRLLITPLPNSEPLIISTGAEESELVKADPAFNEYQVVAKETMYGLSRKFSMTPEQLIALNPELKDGVREGMIIKYPAAKVIGPSSQKHLVQLANTIKNDKRKTLYMLLPFNISRIEGDTAKTTAARLKTDKFLNMTLDFYSGALMAIDSAKTLNLNVDIKILDSQETKNSSAVASLIRNNNIAAGDAVIGPFYQSNAEEAAKLLTTSKVPVVSPLSKEEGTRYENLLQSMPSADLIKATMIDFLRSKNGNISAIVDPKKLSSKQYLSTNHPDIKLVAVTDAGTVTAEAVSAHLVKGKMNYVILDSEKTRTVLNTLDVLLGLQPQYQVQLVILDKNPTLDFEEVPLKKLTMLNLLYPSLTKENSSAAAAIFERKYRETNKVNPNSFAVRGFDVTFDTLLRLSQEQSFMETVETASTEYIENKFEYETQPTGAHINKGIYLLYYDTDLSVKEAN